MTAAIICFDVAFLSWLLWKHWQYERRTRAEWEQSRAQHAAVMERVMKGGR